jgi:hypothetical protein
MVATRNAVVEDRLKHGQCIHCGIQTHTIVKTEGDIEKIPLTISGLVEHGCCLREACQQKGIDVTVCEDQEEDLSNTSSNNSNNNTHSSNNNKLRRARKVLGVAARKVKGVGAHTVVVVVSVAAFGATWMGYPLTGIGLQGFADVVNARIPRRSG